MMIDSAIDTEGEDLYSEEELRNLWESFCDKPDCVQRLSDFGLCSLKAARKLDKQFRKQSAAARRAIAAEERRLETMATTAKEKSKEGSAKPHKTSDVHRKQKMKQAPVTEDPSPVPDGFLHDAIIAAAVAQKHNLSVVEAEGHTKNMVVLVEHVSVDGVPYHRVKTTSYTYHRSRNAAIATARKQHIRLTIYNSASDAQN